MRFDGGARPHGAADRSGAPEDRQAHAGPVRPTAAVALGAAALAGWALLAVAGGGIDSGDGLLGGGPTGAFLALALGAPLAAVVAVLAWRTAALRSAPARLALTGAAGLTAWSALSILWAAAPDLAWLDANRAAIGLCALVVGTGLGALIPRAPRAFGLGLAAAAMPPLVWALGTRVFPAALGDDRALARLADPLGYWNGLALLAVFAVPGLLWLAACPDRDRMRGGMPLAGAGLAVVATVVLLTYSRGGIFAGALACAVALAILPGRGRGLAALVAGGAGAALPAAYGLTDPALTADRLPVDLRESAGLGLGWRLVVGVALGAALAWALPRAAERIGLEGVRGRRAGLAALAVLAVGVVVATAATPAGRDWVGDRWAEVQGEGGDAVANDPGRIVSAAGNQRAAWWGQAWRGFASSPVLGEGAGGFRLVHLAERRVDNDRLRTTETHDVLLRTASGLGIVGLALLAALAAGVVWGVLRAMVDHPRPELALPLSVLAAFALQSAIDWTWAIPALAIPAFAAAGVVLAAAAPGVAPGARRAGGPAVAVLAALVVVAAASALLPWWSARLADSAGGALAADRPRLALERAGDAHALNPLALEPLRLRAAAHTALGQPARAYGAYLEMTRVQPDNPAAWRALARFLGDDPRATDAWRHVQRLDPRDGDAAARIGG